MWMAAGFAMLESGLVRAKNTTEILTKNIALYSVACVMYFICGFAIMYDHPWFLGDLITFSYNIPKEFLDTLPKELPEGVKAIDLYIKSQAAAAGDSYSLASDFFFQVVFVATAMSIVSGAVAERMKLWAFLLFAVVLTGFIYPMEGSWTWNSKDVFGLFNLGSLGWSDFAGSGIVHLAGASAALAAVILLGPRKGKYGPDGKVNPIPGSNMPLAALGTLILWMGWFGFNGGSVLQMDGVDTAHKVAVAFLNTNAAAAAGSIASMALARIWFGKADMTMLINGALAGLVVITAEPTTPTPLQASLFGIIGGLAVVVAIVMIDKLKLDDPVGALSVHGVCGLIGLLLVPVTNADSSFVGQIVGALTIFVWVFGVSFICWFVIKMVIGIRVSEEEEYQGMDLADCGMEAYPEFTKS
ncbi:MAG: ammonium transporter [Gammaproteobacteria bacterium]|nr:MAG: ammonium transporter [Gammaproteobacteria bacterium]